MSNRIGCDCTGCINQDGTCRVDPLARIEEMRKRLAFPLPAPTPEAMPPPPHWQDDHESNEEA